MTRLNVMKGWVLWLAVVAMIAAGCGGGGDRGGNSTADSKVPETFMSALDTAVATRDLDFIGVNISPLFLQDCQDKNGFMTQLSTALGTTGTITFSITAPTNKNVDEIRGKASFTGGFELTVVDGESTRTMAMSGNFYLRAEGGKWKLYGNQQCVH